MTTTTWHKFDPRLGNYEDCNAAMVFESACELLGVAVDPKDILAWSCVDCYRTAFRIQSDGYVAVWTVTMDYDGAPDGHDRCQAVEVRRE